MNILHKLKLWETVDIQSVAQDLQELYVWVDKEWYKEAFKHYCHQGCNRWFADVRGKLMHDRHRHKENVEMVQ